MQPTFLCFRISFPGVKKKLQEIKTQLLSQSTQDKNQNPILIKKADDKLFSIYL